MNISELSHLISTRANGPKRMIVALAGGPGSGKSTLAEELVEALGTSVAILPMDGYHMDNVVLDARGWRARKGAPQTFDVGAFGRDLARVRADDGEVLVPVFDRDLDLSRASARVIGPDVRIVLVDGNYLLLDQAPWSSFVKTYDLKVFIDVPKAVLEERLIRRWLDLGHDQASAEFRARSNDLPNAQLVVAGSVAADVVIRTG